MSMMMKLMYSPVVCITVLTVGILSMSSSAVPWTASTEQISTLEAKVAALEKAQAQDAVAIDRILNGPDAVKVLGHGMAHPFKVSWQWAGDKCANGWARTKGWFKRNPDKVLPIATIPGPSPAKK